MDSLGKFLDFIEENDLFLAEDRILLAVSGGKDSVLMTNLFARTNFKFGIAHCNFHLRAKESDGDEIFVRDLAKDLGVPFFKEDFDTQQVARERQISIQMAARELRYVWFEEIREKNQYNAIALAQHQTDSTETILLNLVRGTGISGLHGILPKRDRLIRPMLAFTSQEIAECVDREKISYREDASNGETKYARNKIRLEVLPALRHINPALESTFVANSRRFHALEQFLEGQVNGIRKAISSEKEDHSLHITVDSLKNYLQNGVLMYELFKPFGFSEMVLSDLVRSLRQTNPISGKSFYSPTHQLLINRKDIVVRKISHIPPSVLDIHELPRKLEWAGKTFNIFFSNDTTLPEKGNILKLDAEKVTLPIKVRSWEIGDSFKPLGFGRRKKVSDFLISQKVSLDEKKEVPIFVNGNEDILWIAPWRADDRYKITPKTKKVIIFEQL